MRVLPRFLVVSFQRLVLELSNIWDVYESVKRASSSTVSFERSVHALIGVRGVFSSAVSLALLVLGKKNATKLPRKKMNDNTTYRGKLAVQTYAADPTSEVNDDAAIKLLKFPIGNMVCCI
jgi:hypothetical protein